MAGSVMLPALKTEDREINGKVFTIQVLPVSDARKAYTILQRFLPGWASEDVANGVGPVLAVGLAGGLNGSDLEELCDLFGKRTTIMQGEARLPIGEKSSPVANSVFAGEFDTMLMWIDACVEINFRGVIEKLKGVLARRAASTPKTENA